MRNFKVNPISSNWMRIKLYFSLFTQTAFNSQLNWDCNNLVAELPLTVISKCIQNTPAIAYARHNSMRNTVLTSDKQAANPFKDVISK